MNLQRLSRITKKKFRKRIQINLQYYPRVVAVNHPIPNYEECFLQLFPILTPFPPTKKEFLLLILAKCDLKNGDESGG